jgi:hypothetical protein
MAFSAELYIDGFKKSTGDSSFVIRKAIAKRNTAFTKGMLLNRGADNLLAPATTNDTKIVGICNQDLAAADNPTAGNTELEYVEINPNDVLLANFDGMLDFTVDNVSGTSTTTKLHSASFNLTDNYLRYGLLYIYEGKNAGQLRMVSASATADDSVTITEALPETPDTTTKGIILATQQAADEGITQGVRGVDINDNAALSSINRPIKIDSTIASEAGPLAVVMDWKLIEYYVPKGVLPVKVIKGDQYRKDV